MSSPNILDAIPANFTGFGVFGYDSAFAEKRGIAIEFTDLRQTSSWALLSESFAVSAAEMIHRECQDLYYPSELDGHLERDCVRRQTADIFGTHCALLSVATAPFTTGPRNGQFAVGFCFKILKGADVTVRLAIPEKDAKDLLLDLVAELSRRNLWVANL